MSTCVKRSSEDLRGCLLQFHKINNAVESAIDRVAYKTDEKERGLATAVSLFIKANLTLFKGVSLKDGVAIIFDAYRDAFVEVLKNDASYKQVLEQVKTSPMQRLASSMQLEQMVERLALERLKIFHSTTPAKAIEESLGLESRISFTGFPDTYVCRNCNKEAFIEFLNVATKA